MHTTLHTEYETLDTLHWVGGVDGHLRLIDQTLLPVEFVEIDCRDVEAVWEAIKTLRVRGAPAIGIAAAYGVCVGVQNVAGDDETAFFNRLREVVDYLATSRPTAVNLFWALKRMSDKAEAAPRPADRRNRRRSARRSPGDPRRRPANVPGDRPAWRRIAPRRAGRADPLQRRRTGHLRLRHRAGRVLCRRRIGQNPARLRRRNPPAPARRSADRLGIAAARDRRHVDLRLDGRPSHARRPRAGRRDRRRPHRRQRRLGQQDRHLFAWPCWPRPTKFPSTSPPRPARSICRLPAARKFPSNSATRAKSPTVSAVKPPPTASKSTIRPSTSPPPN